MALCDPKLFYALVRPRVFHGTMTASQVAGLNTMLERWTAGYATRDKRWLAYCLATAHHETAATMQPIDEWGGGRGRPYGVCDPVTRQTYYGRGDVQLTWKYNYAKQGKRLGIDLVNHPELAKVPTTAAAIMFEGMIAGDFTGKKLGDYFTPELEDPLNARRIINGMDCAELIEATYYVFRDALVNV